MSFTNIDQLVQKFNTHNLSPSVQDIIDNYKPGDTIEDNNDNTIITYCKYVCCGEQMRYYDSQSIICLKCGSIKQQADDTIEVYSNNSYNTHNSCHISFKVNGYSKTAYLQNKLIKGESDYELLKRRHLFIKLMKWRNEIPSKDDSFPLCVINTTIDKYCELQNEHSIVKRASCLDAVLGQILLECCREYGCPRSSQMIANIINLDAESFRAGDKCLTKLSDIMVTNTVDSVEDYSIIYMEKLGIPLCEKYLSFIKDLIHVLTMEQMPASDNKALIRTRIVACISILITNEDIRITKTTIQQETDISVSTFNKFIKFVKKYRSRRAVRLVLQKHNIVNL